MGAVGASRYTTTCGWDSAPHLDERVKQELLDSTPPYLRNARSKGIPSLGSGAIYPIPEDEIIVDPFALPDYWPRAYAADVGWNRTAFLWGAIDRDTGVRYLYAEHYRGQAELSVHAAAARARGDWIPGVMDPAARGRSQVDGQQLLAVYRGLGLDLQPADNSVEAGIYAVYEMLSTGRLKVFSTLKNWFAEYRLYRRDENGKIVKKDDHLMDATRYLVMSGFKRAMVKPAPVNAAPRGRGDPLIGY